MRANAFLRFVTDDVMYYHSPNRSENAEAAAWQRARVLLYNKKFSVCRSTRRNGWSATLNPVGGAAEISTWASATAPFAVADSFIDRPPRGVERELAARGESI